MSRELLLRPTTIIPDELYVARDADRQLERIIREMGRPGYVLVSRQMGKTNLLLHMKRKHETDGDVVVYVDLSERFENVRSCLRNIIDIAIELNPDKFSTLQHQINESRAGQDLEPVIEYGRHLRLLLKQIPLNKIIIIFDEVDSLVNSPYGDIILGQVRSTYFTRTNFPDYYRLAYILSGVAEPTDLIKDKNISPFNIGEKIYLSDFNKREFLEFVKNSEITANETVLNSIFDWTGGNPRMCWDVCAALEELSNDLSTFGSDIVDDIVSKLYLRDFDRPPIDHIRVLVANDSQLRDALVSIRYGKSNTIDEKVRSRLYLSGIINSPSDDFSIKNRIVDHALSDSWLSQVNSQGADILQVASDYYGARRYRLVIEALSCFPQDGVTWPSWSQFQLGVSYFFSEEYNSAVEALAPAVDSLTGDIRTTGLYYLGSSFMMLDRSSDGMRFIEQAANEGTGDFVVPSKIVRLATVYQSHDPASMGRVAQLKADLVRSFDETVSFEGKGFRETVSVSMYNLTLAAIAAKDISSAREFASRCESISTVEQKPKIYLTLLELASTEIEKAQFAAAAAGCVNDNELRVTSNTAALAFTEKVLAATLISLVTTRQIGSLDQFVSRLSRSLQRDTSNMESAIYLATLLSDENHSNIQSLLLWIEGASQELELADGSRLSLLRMLAVNADDKKLESYTQGYISFVERLSDKTILMEADIVFSITTVQRWSGAGRRRDALNLINSIYPGVSSQSAIWSFLLLHYKMSIHNAFNDKQNARLAARGLVELTSSNDLSEGDTAEYASFIENVVRQARLTLAGESSHAPDPFRGIGRNEKIYVTNDDGSNGRLVKFKLVESSLRSGKVVLAAKADLLSL